MPERRPFVLGITGNIACGKSLVSSILAEAGAEVLDADRIAHEVMRPESEVLKQIASQFGEEVINADGSLNRQVLGQIVFSDPKALSTLERITHPPTVREVLRRAGESSASIVVIDAIKLFEAGLADHCDQNWVVYCDPSVQRQRLIERNQFTDAQARQRIDAQPPQEDKVRRADVVIDNSGDIPDTREQVLRALQSTPVA
jgi:dephospho-CoA kinase